MTLQGMDDQIADDEAEEDECPWHECLACGVQWEDK